MKFILRFIVFTLAIVASAYFVSGVFVEGIVPALIAGALLTLIHSIIKPIIKVITLPINLVTFGLFALVLNGIFFWFVSTLINGFSVSDFVSAVWGAVVVSIINWLFNLIVD